MQRIHLLIFSIVLLSLFFSLFVVVDSYKEQNFYTSHCRNLASIIENVYSGDEGLMVNYSLGFAGSLIMENKTVKIIAERTCEETFNSEIIENQIDFNNIITISHTELGVEISG